MKNGSILILANNAEIGSAIAGKVKLLRECDNIRHAGYLEAISILNSSMPQLILVYASNSDSVGIVKEIRALKQLDKVPIILVMDYFVEDLLLYAFDSGADDFFFMNDADSVILMRIIISLQKYMLYKQADIVNDIMINAGIVDKYSNVYTKEKAPLVMKTFFSKSIEDNLENTVFMCVSPVLKPQKKIKDHMLTLGNEIKKILRGNDIIAIGRNSSFYLLLYNAGAAGAKSVIARIKKNLGEDYDIYGTAAEVTASFEEMEPLLVQSLADQIDAGIEFNYLYDFSPAETAEAMNIRDEEGKKFKDFKKEFLGFFEKIAAPVFYQLQKAVAEFFPGAESKFDISENGSSFIMYKGDVSSITEITYPSYMKVIMDIKHVQGSKNPVIRRITLDFEEFSSERLVSILQDVLREFGSMINPDAEENKPSAENK